MAADETSIYTGRELRWIADAYEQAQRIRVQTGERIRAVLQGRDATWGAAEIPGGDADSVLTAIKRGQTEGPVPLLGRTFQRHWNEEQELTQAMKKCLEAHPAWPWLSGVKGIGATLACKLVARLDATKAETPSAFWAYCGLATVPGVEFRCKLCGLRSAFPVGYRVSGNHLRLGGRRPCLGTLEQIRGADEGVRVAQPKPGRGESAAYDQYAKKVCYLIATSFLKAGGPYADFYRRERAKLETERPGWAAGRKHMGALRKTEKLFLTHLWLVWRNALGLPLTQPYAQAVLGHDGDSDIMETLSAAASYGGALTATSEAPAGPVAKATPEGRQTPLPEHLRRAASRRKASYPRSAALESGRQP